MLELIKRLPTDVCLLVFSFDNTYVDIMKRTVCESLVKSVKDKNINRFISFIETHYADVLFSHTYFDSVLNNKTSNASCFRMRKNMKTLVEQFEKNGFCVSKMNISNCKITPDDRYLGVTLNIDIYDNFGNLCKRDAIMTDLNDLVVIVNKP
jgi:hypothetical protein